jgi:hypothetical protein
MFGARDSKPFLGRAGPSRTTIKDIGLNSLKFLPTRGSSVNIPYFSDLPDLGTLILFGKISPQAGVLEST